MRLCASIWGQMKWLRGHMGVVATSLIIIRQTEAARDHPRCWKGVERTRAVEARERERAIFTLVHISPREAAAVCLRCPYPEAALSIRHTCPLIRRWHTRCFIHRTPPPPLIQPPLSLSRNLTPCIKSANTQNPPPPLRRTRCCTTLASRTIIYAFESHTHAHLLL